MTTPAPLWAVSGALGDPRIANLSDPGVGGSREPQSGGVRRPGGVGGAVSRDGGRHRDLAAPVVVRVRRKRWAGWLILLLIAAGLGLLAWTADSGRLLKACDMYEIHDMQPAYCRYDLPPTP